MFYFTDMTIGDFNSGVVAPSVVTLQFVRYNTTLPAFEIKNIKHVSSDFCPKEQYNNSYIKDHTL